MRKNALSCLLAVAITPLFAETVSSTSILIASENHRQKTQITKKPKSSLTPEISLRETFGIRHALVTTPSIAVTPQQNPQSQLLSKINHIIDSVSPISNNIQTKIAVSVTKNPQTSPQVTNHSALNDLNEQSLLSPSVKSSATSKFPKISRSSLFPQTSNNSPLVNPAPATERVASVFGWRIRPFSGRWQMHNGIDYGAPLGSPVVAARDGIVTKVVSGCLDFRQRWCGSQFGNWIEIDHGSGMVATYAHLLNNSITVQEGTKVWQNQEIAKVGSSGWSTGAHLDFRIKINGEFKNPADYVKN